MKFRSGFVSNSSTSSYVLIVPKDLHEKVVESSHPYVRAAMESLVTERKFDGKSIMYMHYGGYDFSLSEFGDEIIWEKEIPSEKEIWTDLEKPWGTPSDEEIDLYDIFEEYYKRKLKELGEEDSIIDFVMDL